MSAAVDLVAPSSETAFFRQLYLEPTFFAHRILRVGELDVFQREFLEAVAANPRVGLSACVGPGKTAGLSWVAWWWLYTRQDAQAIAASVTRENLRDNLWKELAVWFDRSPELRDTFEFGVERITHRERPDVWWMSARGWARDANPAAQASALGGFHGRAVLVLLDEMGTLPDSVLVTAERIFANAEIDEARLVGAWNPETTDGAAYRICTRDRRRWAIIHVTGDPDDPRRAKRISLEYARQAIADWGRENDWVRVNILGEFPRVGSDKLLGPDDVQRAQARDVHERAIEGEPSVWGLDVARSPSGDRSVLRERVGPVAFRPYVWRGLDGPSLAERVSLVLLESKRRPDYLFVDADGVGASPLDHLKVLGWGPVLMPVSFGGEAADPRYMDKGAEMYGRLAEWVRKTGCLPSDSNQLGSELTTRSYRYRPRGKRVAFCLESKEELQKRGLPSPDEADALALTFAQYPLPKREWLEEARKQGAFAGAKQARHEVMWGARGRQAEQGR